ncbi:hypothetical protein Btru_075963 [Bulinus truncatus]|nr:hypothetical protein Btru_075963 [Bulinus truncatus]
MQPTFPSRMPFVMSCYSVRQNRAFQVGNLDKVSGLTNEAVFNMISKDNDKLQSSFTENKDKCQDPTTQTAVKSQADMLGYLCSVEGRRAWSSLENSVCVTNKLAVNNAQALMVACLNTYDPEFQSALNQAQNSGEKPDNSSVCPSVDKLSNCINNALNNNCGTSFGSVFKTLWVITFIPVAGQLRQIRT